jgi:hypothetical protein
MFDRQPPQCPQLRDKGGGGGDFYAPPRRGYPLCATGGAPPRAEGAKSKLVHLLPRAHSLQTDLSLLPQPAIMQQSKQQQDPGSRSSTQHTQQKQSRSDPSSRQTWACWCCAGCAVTVTVSRVRHGQHTHTQPANSSMNHEQQPAAGSHPTGPRAPGTIARGSMQCLVPQSAVCVGWLATGDWTRTRRDWLNAVRQAQPAA